LALTCNKLEINFQTLKHYVNNNPKCSPKIPNFSNSNFALIVPGSGTTGISKLIAIDFTNLNKLISRDLIARTIQEKEHHLSFTPVEFYTAKRRNFSCLQAGACVVMRENFNTTLFQFFKNNTIEHVSLASSHAKDLMQGDTNLARQLFLNTKTVFLGGS